MRMAAWLWVWVVCGSASVAEAQTYLHGSMTTVRSCTGMYYDSGGPTAPHSDSESSTMTFCNPGVGSITLSFSSLALESCCDALTLYDGMDASGPLIGSYTGSTSPGVVTSTSSCITAQFNSDGSVTYEGWAATISCGATMLLGNGSPCSTASMCASGYCVDRVCCESACDDGLLCDGAESCGTGVCEPGAPLECDDFDPCTADSCVEGFGCESEPIPGCGGFDAGPSRDAGGPTLRDAGSGGGGAGGGGRRSGRGCAVSGATGVGADLVGVVVTCLAISLAFARRRRQRTMS